MRTEIIINSDNNDEPQKIVVELPRMCPQCCLTVKPIHINYELEISHASELIARNNRNRH